MKFKTFLFGVLTLSFLPLLTLSGYASERKPLIVVGDANFPPVEYIEDGRVKGFNTQIWQELSKAMNRPVEIRLMLWKDAQQKVLNGEADALTLLGRTKKREKLYDFSEPTLTFEFCFFVRSDDVPFETIKDYEGRTIGVTKGGYAREVLESHKNIKLLFMKNNLEGFQLLTSGKIDAVGTDKWVGAYTIQKHQIKGINIVEKPFAKSIASIPVKKGNLKLLNEINNGIKKLKKDKAIQKILDKWSPKEVVFLTKERIKRIITIAVTAFLIAVIVFSLLWIVLLKRQVNTKTKELRQEIEEHKQAEEELRESEERHRLFFENSPIGIIHYNNKGIITAVNDAMIDTFGSSLEQLVGLDINDIPDKKLAKAVFKSLNGELGYYEGEYTSYTGGKHTIIKNISIPIIRDGEVIAGVGIVENLTEQKKMQEELLKAKKLESLGTLAGGIAHDFNNMLAAVLGNISLARMETGPGSNVFELLTEAETAGMRAKELTARLITFSRGGEPVKEVTSIGDLVKDSVSSTLSDSGIDYEISIPDDLSPVEIDEVQMKQVIYGITTNALEAMTGKGLIKVYCENVTVEEKDALTLRKGKYVRISIEDQGVGIPKEDLQKIFDPYFSTKEMGPDKGQGLGLSICHSIVAKHDGLIAVESELGVGTTFSIYLPAIALAQARPAGLPASEKEIAEFEPVKKAVPARPVTGRGKILVMDDEKMVRNVSAALLNKLGSDVELAIDGAEAIEMYKKARESGEPFDAVILDLTNQFGMGGKEAIEKLREIDPDVKAIISSGYSNDPIMSNFGAYGFRGVLAKPFTMDELSKGLNGVITGKDE